MLFPVKKSVPVMKWLLMAIVVAGTWSVPVV